MHLRCGGIYNNQFVTESLLSLLAKEFGKLVNIQRSYGQEKHVPFFDSWDVCWTVIHHV